VLFLAAIAIAATFLDPSKTTGGGERRPIAHGREVTETGGGQSPTAAPATPLQVMPAPAEWTVLFVEVAPGGGDQIISRSRVASVDLAYAGAPRPGMPEDGWLLIAEAKVDLPSGRFFIVIEYDAEVRVFIDGRETAYQQSPRRSSQLSVTFGHAGGTVTIRVEATDSGGGFVLRVR